MIQIYEARRASGAAGPVGISFLGSPRSSPNNFEFQATNKLRLQYLAARLYDLGPKPLFHFLDEVERGADLRSQLEKYARLPCEFVRAFGGDRFLPSLYLVREGRL